jgi:hypothetical protein
MEMRMVLRRVLERAALQPAGRRRSKVQFRAITLAPHDGARVIQQRAPLPAADLP